MERKNIVTFKYFRLTSEDIPTTSLDNVTNLDHLIKSPKTGSKDIRNKPSCEYMKDRLA